MPNHQKILKKSIKFIKDGYLSNKNISYNPNYFLTSWTDSIGYINIKNISKNNVSLFKKYKIILKEFFSINMDKIEYKNKINLKNYKNLVMSYFFHENLKQNGSYDDRYFSMNTDIDKKTLWILVPFNEINKQYKTKKNIIVLKRQNINLSKNIFFSFKMFVKNFFSTFFFIKTKKIKFKNTNFSENLSEIISNILIESKINKLIFPYESQPHQHYLTEKLKQQKKKLKIIGYMHTVIPPLPLDYIKRTGHPDIVYVNGLSQKKILCSKLGWKKNEVKNINSLRYKKKINFSYNKNIFLPYFLEDENKIFKYFQKLIFTKGQGYFPNLRIRNHPAMNNSKNHINLIKKLKKFLKQNKNFFKDTKTNKKIFICFGSTASIIEGLERGFRAFHICSDTTLEKFDNFYWKQIKISCINSNTFEYKLKTKGSLIKLSNQKSQIIKL